MNAPDRGMRRDQRGQQLRSSSISDFLISDEARYFTEIAIYVSGQAHPPFGIW